MNKTIGFCVTSAMFAVAGAMQLSAGVVESTELGAWTSEVANAQLTSSNGSITVTFTPDAPEAIPTWQWAYLIAGGWSGSSTYGGNYLAAGVQGVSLCLRSATGSRPSEIILRMKSKVGQGSLGWDVKPLMAPDSAGGWKVNSRMLARSDGWKSNPTGYDTDTWFTNSLTNVQMIGVHIAPSAGFTATETYSIDSFTLYGDGYSAWAANLVPVQRVFDYFKVSSLSDVPTQLDTDGDGLSDFLELIAGTDPTVKASVFAAEIVSVSAGSVVLRWPSTAGGMYTLLESTDLSSAGFVPLQANIPASDGEYTYCTNAVAGTAPKFYRVMKQ